MHCSDTVNKCIKNKANCYLDESAIVSSQHEDTRTLINDTFSICRKGQNQAVNSFSSHLINDQKTYKIKSQ